MPARCLREVRELIGKGPAAEAFAKGFAESYFAQAFGVLPKAELDLLVFRLLIECGVIDPNGSIFSMARALNATPGKAKGLLFQYQLRCMDEVEAEKAVLDSLARARFTVDDKRLSFGIGSPLARATIDGRLKALDVYSEVSLSGDILKVPLDQFDLFITGLIGEERATELERALKKDGHLKDGSLRAHLKKYGAEAAKGGANAAGRKGMRNLFSGLSDWVSGGGLEALPDILGGLG